MKKRTCVSFFLLLGFAAFLQAQWPGFYSAPYGGGWYPNGPMPQGSYWGGPMFSGTTTPAGGMFSFPAPSSAQQEAAVEFTSSNLPLVLIETQGRPITQQGKVTATMRVVDGGPLRRNAPGDEANGYDGFIGIKVRGNSSASFPQKRYTLETRDETGASRDVALLDLPADNDFVLFGPYNDISMMRDVLAFHLWNEMGHWGPHTCYVELLLDGVYQGVYVLTETIKRTAGRLDIAKLKAGDNEGLELTGGYIVRIDAYDADDRTFPSAVQGISTSMFGAHSSGSLPGLPMAPAGGMGLSGMGVPAGGAPQVVWTCVYPDKEDLTEAQFNYIRDFVNRTELAIQEGDYASCINLSSFVDYFIHTELSLNADAYKRSAYFYKTKQNADGSGGKLHAGPVWDYNLAYGNCNFCNAGNIHAWAYDGCETNPTPPMWKTLAGDPAFMARVRERYAELRRSVLSKESLNRFVDSRAALLDEAKDRQLALYSDLLQPAQGGAGNNPWGWFVDRTGGTQWYAAYTVSSYEEEIKTLKQWLSDRIDVLDSQWLSPRRQDVR